MPFAARLAHFLRLLCQHRPLSARAWPRLAQWLALCAGLQWAVRCACGSSGLRCAGLAA